MPSVTVLQPLKAKYNMTLYLSIFFKSQYCKGFQGIISILSLCMKDFRGIFITTYRLFTITPQFAL